jgi:hypothetical protein
VVEFFDVPIQIKICATNDRVKVFSFSPIDLSEMKVRLVVALISHFLYKSR